MEPMMYSEDDCMLCPLLYQESFKSIPSGTARLSQTFSTHDKQNVQLELGNFTQQSSMSTSSNKFPSVFYQDNGKPIPQKPIMLLPDANNHTYSQQNIDDMLELHNQLVGGACQIVPKTNL